MKKLLVLMAFFAFSSNAISFALTGDTLNGIAATAFLVSTGALLWMNWKRPGPTTTETRKAGAK
jgi:hypothetical protein